VKISFFTHLLSDWTLQPESAFELMKTEKREEKLKAAFAEIGNLNTFHIWRNGHFNLLFHAVLTVNLMALKVLLQLKADPTKTNKRGINVLHLIAKRGDIAMADLCLNNVKSQEDKISFVNNRTEIGKMVKLIVIVQVSGPVFEFRADETRDGIHQIVIRTLSVFCYLC
jgi:hypothetical protein